MADAAPNAATVLAAALDQLRMPIAALDHKLRIIFCNQAFAEHFACSCHPGQLLGDALGLAPGCDLLQTLHSALAQQAGELALEPSPSTGFVAGRIVPQAWGGLLQLENKLERETLEAQQWQLLDRIAHEFQTPLTSIVGYSEILLQQHAASADVTQNFLARILAQGQRLSRVTDDLLFLSRLQATSATLVRVPLDLRFPVCSAFDAQIDAAEQQGMGLSLDVPRLPVMVAGNEAALLELVSNLMENSIKYAGFGAELNVSLAAGAADARLTVQDNGFGIRADLQHKVFDRFFRSDEAGRSGKSGSGLGLAKVQQIVLAHRGQVELISAPGAGASFIVTLPLLGLADGAM